MATEVVSTIRSSGGDYTSLSAWEAGEQNNLVTADEIAIAECYDDWPSGLSDTVSIAGWTTDATRYVVVRPASGNGHTGTPESGFWVTSSGSVRTLAVSQAYTQIIGIEVRQTGTADAFQLNATGALAIAVLAKCASTTKAAIGLDNGKAYCCMAWGGGYGFYMAASTQALNCVAANCSSRGYWANATSALAKNCVAYNNTTNYLGTFSASSTHNATSSASDDAPGGNSVTGISSSDFVDAASNDFHLASGSVLIGAGTNLYSDFTTDIDGDTWPSSGAWDIGFDYRVAGSSPQTVAIGQVTETDTAQAFTVTTTLAAAIGQASETNTAQALTPVTGGSPQSVGIGQAAESDSAQPLTAVATRTVAIGQAQETDTAQALSPVVGGATLIGQASETDTAQALTAVPGVRTVAVGQASETDSAQAMSARAATAILAGMALEIDTAQPMTAFISGASLVIGQASELDIAQALASVGGTSSWTPGDGAMSPPRIGMARNGELWTLVIDDDNVPTHAKRRGTNRLVKVHALPGGNQGQVMTATGVVLVVM